MTRVFRRRSVRELAAASASPMHPDVVMRAQSIVTDVRDRGESAVREYAGRFDGLAAEQALVIRRPELEAALDALPPDDRRRLTRIAERIGAFAEGQRRALAPFEIRIPGGRAGHEIAPVMSAGCYAPGGRYPLPSSVLMTAITARVAGVRSVWVASPRRDSIMLASAALAGADGFLGVGGAHAIAALAFGAGEVPSCDIVVGPGNAYVTAAKRLVFGHVGIDALAGPSELLVVGDVGADAGNIAADLLAQAEHDPDALPVLVSIGESLVARVTMELERQLECLPTADVARASLQNGGYIVVDTIEEAIAACNQLAPEHLHLHVRLDAVARDCLQHYGALFRGPCSAETLGDYGAGPNHVLPTGRAARYAGGLSVLTFLRVRTWLQMEETSEARELYADAAWLGRIEGLEAHARASDRRVSGQGSPDALVGRK